MVEGFCCAGCRRNRPSPPVYPRRPSSPKCECHRAAQFRLVAISRLHLRRRKWHPMGNFTMNITCIWTTVAFKNKHIKCRRVPSDQDGYFGIVHVVDASEKTRAVFWYGFNWLPFHFFAREFSDWICARKTYRSSRARSSSTVLSTGHGRAAAYSPQILARRHQLSCLICKLLLMGRPPKHLHVGVPSLRDFSRRFTKDTSTPFCFFICFPLVKLG